MPDFYRDPVPAEPSGTQHQHVSPSARSMFEDSSRVFMHSRPMTEPRDGGFVHSSSVKSEHPPSDKSERLRSVKMEPNMTPLPGSSVGGSTMASVKSEWVTQGMVGSYYRSNRRSLGSRSGSNRSGGASGVALL